MFLQYPLTFLFIQLGAATKLRITLPQGLVVLDETPSSSQNDFGSTWTGEMPWPIGLDRSVKNCQELAGNISEAVVIAVAAEENPTNDSPVDGHIAKIRTFNWFNNDYGNLLFSVYTNPSSNKAYIASVPRSNSVKSAAWDKIKSRAPRLNKAISELDMPYPISTAILHGEEVAYRLFEDDINMQLPSITPFDRMKGITVAPQRGYPVGSVVGSWKIKAGRNSVSEPKGACEPDNPMRSNISDRKSRTACIVISNELGVQTVTGLVPRPGSETAKLAICGHGSSSKAFARRTASDGNDKRCPLALQNSNGQGILAMSSAPAFATTKPKDFSGSAHLRQTKSKVINPSSKQTTLKTVITKSNSNQASPTQSNNSAAKLKTAASPKTTAKAPILKPNGSDSNPKKSKLTNKA